MAPRFYLVPAVFDARNHRLPKYYNTFPPNTPADWLDFGSEPTFLCVFDLDAAGHTALVANSDVSTFPVNIDAQVGANVATVAAELETFNLPGDAVTSGSTYRNIIRGIIAIISVMQRYSAITGNVLVFDGLTNLDRTLGSIPSNIRNGLQQACDELKYSTAGLVGSSTIRALLKQLATQPRDITLLGIPI